MLAEVKQTSGKKISTPIVYMTPCCVYNEPSQVGFFTFDLKSVLLIDCNFVVVE